ncbi:MAG: ABC-2 family transporter protein [bacterium]|nr:ABC-2 family transporter protein [bacterium]
MNSFLTLFRISLEQYFIYRLSFVLWRFRMVLNFLLIFFLWSAIYENKVSLFGYSRQEMFTYILIMNLLGALLFSSRTGDLAGEIRDGKVINYIMKPFSVLRQLLTKEAADKLINGSFQIVETVSIILIFKPPMFIQSDPFVYVAVLVSLCINILISFLVLYLLSLIAFWTAEVWAPRFIYFIFISLLSGSMYPLDILPKSLYTILLFTPFPYFNYLPTRIYLKGFSVSLIFPFFMSLVWVVILYFLSRKIWNKGMKEFSFFGR